MKRGVVVARDAAELEFQKLCDFWEIEIEEVDTDISEKILNAFMRGRVNFESGSEVIRYTLRTPVDLENGEKLSELVLREPTAQELKGKDKLSPVDAGLGLLSTITGVPLGVLSRLKVKDLTVASSLLNFLA